MLVVFVGLVTVAGDAEELLSGYKFKYKAAKTPDVDRLVNFFFQNKLWSP